MANRFVPILMRFHRPLRPLFSSARLLHGKADPYADEGGQNEKRQQFNRGIRMLTVGITGVAFGLWSLTRDEKQSDDQPTERPRRVSAESRPNRKGDGNSKESRLAAIKTLNVVADVVEEVAPAVVSISIGGQSRWFFSGSVPSGSGFIVDPQGLVLTNAHVLGGGQGTVHVQLADGRKFVGTVLAVDPSTDLALIKINTPYVRATLDEVHRYASIVSNGLFHRNFDKDTVGGYRIPADSTIFPVLYSCHHDPDVWQEPEQFRPERFLTDDGKEYKARVELIPFSLGRRACLGESLARMEFFLFAAFLMQRFSVELSEEKSRDLEEVLLGTEGGLRSIEGFKLIFSVR